MLYQAKSNCITYLRTFYESDYEGDNILARAIIQKIIEKPEELENSKTYEAIADNLEKTWESSLVNKTHWSAYFLNLQQIIEECWNAGTLIGPGRGSGVGFILLYLLDIIQINPLRETTETFSFKTQTWIHEPIQDVKEEYLPTITIATDFSFLFYENVYAGMGKYIGYCSPEQNGWACKVTDGSGVIFCACSFAIVFKLPCGISSVI